MKTGVPAGEPLWILVWVLLSECHPCEGYFDGSFCFY